MAKRGRPRKITNTVLRKLEEGFLKGLSDRECCIYADIAPSTLYDYCKEHPDFSERKEVLKENVAARAKINIADQIENGDVSLSAWYLERKCRDEFSLKQEVQMNAKVNNPFAELSIEELKRLAGE